MSKTIALTLQDFEVHGDGYLEPVVIRVTEGEYQVLLDCKNIPTTVWEQAEAIKLIMARVQVITEFPVSIDAVMLI